MQPSVVFRLLFSHIEKIIKPYIEQIQYETMSTLGVELIPTKSDKTNIRFDKSHLKVEYKIKLFYAVSKMSSSIAWRLQ